jgi:hypothetical protein
MSAINSRDVDELLERADHAHTPEAAQAFATQALVHQVALLTEQQRIANEQSKELIAHVARPNN